MNFGTRRISNQDNNFFCEGWTVFVPPDMIERACEDIEDCGLWIADCGFEKSPRGGIAREYLADRGWNKRLRALFRIVSGKFGLFRIAVGGGRRKGSVSACRSNGVSASGNAEAVGRLTIRTFFGRKVHLRPRLSRFVAVCPLKGGPGERAGEKSIGVSGYRGVGESAGWQGKSGVAASLCHRRCPRRRGISGGGSVVEYRGNPFVELSYEPI
jgi:hypothetical protein